MADYRFVVSDPKTGSSFQKVMDKKTVPALTGLSIGQELDGGMIGLPGYKLLLTGGSDNDGFPMRKDVQGAVRKDILLTKGRGYRKEGDVRKRKLIRGKSFSQDIAQVNLKVEKYGLKSLEEIFGKTAKKEGEAAPAEAEKKA